MGCSKFYELFENNRPIDV